MKENPACPGDDKLCDIETFKTHGKNCIQNNKKNKNCETFKKQLEVVNEIIKNKEDEGINGLIKALFDKNDKNDEKVKEFIHLECTQNKITSVQNCCTDVDSGNFESAKNTCSQVDGGFFSNVDWLSLLGNTASMFSEVYESTLEGNEKKALARLGCSGLSATGNQIVQKENIIKKCEKVINFCQIGCGQEFNRFKNIANTDNILNIDQMLDEMKNFSNINEKLRQWLKKVKDANEAEISTDEKKLIFQSLARAFMHYQGSQSIADKDFTHRSCALNNGRSGLAERLARERAQYNEKVKKTFDSLNLLCQQAVSLLINDKIKVPKAKSPSVLNVNSPFKNFKTPKKRMTSALPGRQGADFNIQNPDEGGLFGQGEGAEGVYAPDGSSSSAEIAKAEEKDKKGIGPDYDRALNEFFSKGGSDNFGAGPTPTLGFSGSAESVNLKTLVDVGKKNNERENYYPRALSSEPAYGFGDINGSLWQQHHKGFKNVCHILKHCKR